MNLIKSGISSDISAVLPQAMQLRHQLHRDPELTWQEHRTAATIAKQLNEIKGLKVKTGVGRLGIIADLDGPQPGPTIALRADMDALPVLEKTKGIDYVSCNDGVMHACGHDGHMANLMAAAWVLSKNRDKLPGRVRFIFQPAEEGGAGARAMVEDGALDGVDAIFGLHGWPELKAGHIYYCPGPMMAGNAQVHIRIKGKGGHAALPHLCTDQVLAAGRLIEQASTLRHRMINPSEPFVLTLTSVHGGNTHNVIPEEVSIQGTMRFLSRKTYECAHEKLDAICQGLGQQMGISVALETIPGYPPLVNDILATRYLQEIAESALGTERAQRSPFPTMGAEDFAYFLEKVPGSYFFLGMDDDRQGGYPSLHHPEYNFNDGGLETGVQLFVQLALNFARYSDFKQA